MAGELLSVPQGKFRAELIDIADASVNAAVSLATAVTALPKDPVMFTHTRAVASHSRQARKIVRDWSAVLLSGHAIPISLRMNRFLTTPQALFESYRSMAFALEQAYLKIS
jgi:hypothetical protein